jgi:hypothetical protein
LGEDRRDEKSHISHGMRKRPAHTMDSLLPFHAVRHFRVREAAMAWPEAVEEVEGRGDADRATLFLFSTAFCTRDQM